MLSAEHYALESATVKQLLRIREAEVKYYKDRFESVTIQSGLLSGLVVQTLSQIDAMQHNSLAVRTLFWWCGALAFSCSTFCMVMATFVVESFYFILKISY